MSKMSNSPDIDPAASLTAMRDDIDRIDLSMHELLMERGRIIDTLIAIKAKQGGGSAFRPGREAAMMRRLALRHEGILPLDTAESIWRIIIATFTYVQSNFNVHADTTGGDAAMRDATRFHFGFTVPLVTHDSPGEVIEAVAESSGDLGILRIGAGIQAGAWWKRLEGDSRPKIIARLPFVDRPDHPAGLPVFTISPPLAEASARETLIYSAEVTQWRPAISRQLAALDVTIISDAGTPLGLALLLSAPGEVMRDAINDALAAGGTNDARVSEIGSHATQHKLAT